MSGPKLRVRSSGHGGSGYKHPHTGSLVPGVTTVLRKLEKPAIAQWAVDNTAAFAVANIDSLLSRTEEQGFGFLRWYWKRDPIKGDTDDIRNYSNGVLNDAANLAPQHFWEMVAEWDKWKLDNDVKPLLTETTFWSAQYGYAGTADGLWEVNGETILVDVKTSRNVWDEHYMQLAALGACDTMLVESSEDVWVESEIPGFQKYALLHIRPSDTDKTGNPMLPFCRLEFVDMDEMPDHFEAFLGLLAVSEAQNRVRKHRNGGK